MQLAKNRHVMKLRALTPERARLSPAIAVTAPELVALVVGARAVVLAWSRHHAALGSADCWSDCAGLTMSSSAGKKIWLPLKRTGQSLALLVPLKPFPVAR